MLPLRRLVRENKELRDKLMENKDNQEEKEKIMKEVNQPLTEKDFE